MAGTRGRLIIYGVGGHGLVVADAATAAGWDVVGFVDDDVSADAPVPDKWARLELSQLESNGAAVIVAVGDNLARQRIGERLGARGIELATVVHPAAWVSPLADVGDGVFVGPGAVVQAAARIGRGAIVNSAAVVEHHCEIGEWAHIGPGAVLGGRVVVGAFSLVGTGASVRPGARIGEGATVGAGAVVVGDVADGATVAGNPARALTS